MTKKYYQQQPSFSLQRLQLVNQLSTRTASVNPKKKLQQFLKRAKNPNPTISINMAIGQKLKHQLVQKKVAKNAFAIVVKNKPKISLNQVTIGMTGKSQPRRHVLFQVKRLITANAMVVLPQKWKPFQRNTICNLFPTIRAKAKLQK